MPRATGEHLQTEVAALRHDLGTLERRLADAQAAQSDQRETLKEQVVILGQTVNKLSTASRVADADMGSQLERMLQDVATLRGAVEDNAHLLGEAQSQQNKLTQELTARIAALQPKASAQGKERASQATQKAMPTGKKELLAYGLKLLGNSKTVADGRSVLREVGRKYAAERGVGDEALLALGQSYLAAKKYDAAQRELIRLVDVQPKSPRVAEAFMKLAACSEALGRLEDAQTFYNEVVSNHRRANVYGAAKARLAQISAQLPKTPAAPAAPATPATKP
jgi:TolA-binding protein